MPRYVQHAREHPALFEVMFVFRPEWAGAPADELPLATEAFGTGLAAIEEAITTGRIQGDPFMVALTVWSAMHGVASILLASPELGDATESDLVEQVIDTVLAGLAPPRDRRRSAPGADQPDRDPHRDARSRRRRAR